MNKEKASQLEARFVELASYGLNCKQISEIMEINPKRFGLLMHEILGVYPSVYIARMKNAQT